ncbi:MAG: undecaprenyldiphospho-muramoylpentapeptide beta-N-acetylglucosaminyltransferase [Elusimicrobia bacterium]|nr:undecaprenyldiphospho-muramoylpentapeptide beta-N-acetylglucosaminyltransferase [Elusimicrobiota bacterium]
MKIVFIAASGSGGHIYPGIAVADEINERFEPIFILSKNQASKDIISKTSYKYLTLPVCGMPAVFSLKFLYFLLTLSVSTVKSVFLILKYKPAVCVGMAGYASVPVVLAAKLLRKKTLICEQNVVPGKATKLLSKIADTVCLSFEETKKYINSKNTIVTGNPVRRELLNADKSSALKSFGFSDKGQVILIFGGSQGSSKLNDIAFQTACKLIESQKINVIHVTGKKDFPLISRKAAKYSEHYKVFEYIYDMAQAYAASDIVICRAGAGTISELYHLRKPAVLVPYPYAGAHQAQNAKFLEYKGLAEAIEEAGLNVNILLKALKGILLKSAPADFEGGGNITLPQTIIADEILKTGK